MTSRDRCASLNTIAVRGALSGATLRPAQFFLEPWPAAQTNRGTGHSIRGELCE